LKRKRKEQLPCCCDPIIDNVMGKGGKDLSMLFSPAGRTELERHGLLFSVNATTWGGKEKIPILLERSEE